MGILAAIYIIYIRNNGSEYVNGEGTWGTRTMGHREREGYINRKKIKKLFESSGEIKNCGIEKYKNKKIS